MSAGSYAIRDSATMLRRNLLHVMRYPSMTFGVLLVPVFMLLLFRYAFGATLGAGIGARAGGYINYLTPGILVLAVSSASVSTAVAVNTDMTEGIINRFRTMAIARVSVLTGHVLGSVIQTVASTVVVTGIALAFGFRPAASPAGWLGAVALVVVLAFACTWVSVALGLLARNPTPKAQAITRCRWRSCPFSAAPSFPRRRWRPGCAGSPSTSRSRPSSTPCAPCCSAPRPETNSRSRTPGAPG
jgi:ABC-2 type transport system permease protein